MSVIIDGSLLHVKQSFVLTVVTSNMGFYDKLSAGHGWQAFLSARDGSAEGWPYRASNER